MPSLRATYILLLAFFLPWPPAHAQQPIQPTPANAATPATTQAAPSTKITNVRVVGI
jgi:hypothetical protein